MKAVRASPTAAKPAAKSQGQWQQVRGGRRSQPGSSASAGKAAAAETARDAPLAPSRDAFPDNWEERLKTTVGVSVVFRTHQKPGANPADQQQLTQFAATNMLNQLAAAQHPALFETVQVRNLGAVTSPKCAEAHAHTPRLRDHPHAITSKTVEALFVVPGALAEQLTQKLLASVDGWMPLAYGLQATVLVGSDHIRVAKLRCAGGMLPPAELQAFLVRQHEAGYLPFEALRVTQPSCPVGPISSVLADSYTVVMRCPDGTTPPSRFYLLDGGRVECSLSLLNPAPSGEPATIRQLAAEVRRLAGLQLATSAKQRKQHRTDTPSQGGDTSGGGAGSPGGLQASAGGTQAPAGGADSPPQQQQQQQQQQDATQPPPAAHPPDPASTQQAGPASSNGPDTGPPLQAPAGADQQPPSTGAGEGDGQAQQEHAAARQEGQASGSAQEGGAPPGGGAAAGQASAGEAPGASQPSPQPQPRLPSLQQQQGDPEEMAEVRGRSGLGARLADTGGRDDSRAKQRRLDDSGTTATAGSGGTVGGKDHGKSFAAVAGQRGASANGGTAPSPT
jgi:hypothetical protein